MDCIIANGSMNARIGTSDPTAYESAHRKRRPQSAIFGFARIDAELVAHHFVQVDFGMLCEAPDDHLGLVRAEAFEFVECDLFAELALRICSHLALFHVDRRLHDLAFGFPSEIFADAHRECTREQRKKTTNEDRSAIVLCDADAGNDAQRREDTVLHSEDDLANAAPLLQAAALRRIGDARFDLLPARYVNDDVLHRRREAGEISESLIGKDLEGNRAELLAASSSS